MNFEKFSLALLFISFLIAPASFAIASDTNAIKNSICDVTMAHDSLTAEFVPYEPVSIKAGEEFVAKINIRNKTVYKYKNTKILSKVYFISDEDIKSGKAGKIVSFGLLEGSFDVNPGSNKTETIKWKSPEISTSGLYRIDIYVIQNGVHVIGDFARDETAISTGYFNVVGESSDRSSIEFNKNKTTFSGALYEAYKMILFGEDDIGRDVNFFIKNINEDKQEVKVSWSVYEYGMFGKDNILLSTSTIINIDKGEESNVKLEIPLTPSNRYHAVLDLENNGIHTIEVFRWARNVVSPSSLDNYGIVQGGEFLTEQELEGEFALKKGKKYVAFACIVGGYKQAPSTVTMRLRDDKGNIIFSREETKMSGIETAKFEYPFIPTKYSKKMQLDVVVRTEGFETKSSWMNGCNNNQSDGCKKDPWFSGNMAKYLISLFIIACLFVITSLHKKF